MNNEQIAKALGLKADTILPDLSSREWREVIRERVRTLLCYRDYAIEYRWWCNTDSETHDLCIGPVQYLKDECYLKQIAHFQDETEQEVWLAALEWLTNCDTESFS